MAKKRKKRTRAKRAKRPGVAHYNAVQEPITMDDMMTTRHIKAEFARRLQEAMIEKGWNQSALAARANEHLPRAEKGRKRGSKIGRDSISHYVRGRMLPLPLYLSAIAAALGKRPEDLLPARGVPTAAGPAIPFEMRGLPDGRVSLRLNRTIRETAAMKIMQLLAEEDRTP